MTGDGRRRHGRGWTTEAREGMYEEQGREEEGGKGLSGTLDFQTRVTLPVFLPDCRRPSTRQQIRRGDGVEALCARLVLPFLQQCFPNGVSRAPYAAKFGAVTHGAVVWGGILSGAEGTSDLIPPNTVVPTRKLQFFSTAAVPSAPSGVPQVEVTFEIDANRNVSKAVSSLKDIDRIVAEAEQFATEDDTQHKRVEAFNSLSAFVNGLNTQFGNWEGPSDEES
ncbi:hypothetical protein BDN72DRAFT_945603 [Pluteus cervinus]|uniref:Uncharacterized protein n=1 Tax=Pluteus cervinus TaxID=181527 RepID=A0ACD3A0U1_9AGAR|nr:hypothetical protein BDN72DRAFT_945603 [Pluteus cervinus]